MPAACRWFSSRPDIANARIQFKNGCVANLTASRVSTEKIRKLRFFQPRQYVSIDYIRREGVCIGLDEGGQLRFVTLRPDDGEPLQRQLRAFVDCVRNRSAPRVSGLDGLRALELAIRNKGRPLKSTHAWLRRLWRPASNWTRKAVLEILLLLEDYSRSMQRRLSVARSVRLAPSERPIWLSVADFQQRLEWQLAQRPDAGRIAPSNVPPPEFLAGRLDAAALLRKARGAGNWPADLSTPVGIETEWVSRKIYPWAAASVLHAMAMAYLLVPPTMQLETTKPPDWDSIQITLATPALDDLPPLEGESDVPGEGEGGFRGMPQPAIEPAPGPSPLPDIPVDQEEVGGSVAAGRGARVRRSRESASPRAGRRTESSRGAYLPEPGPGRVPEGH